MNYKSIIFKNDKLYCSRPYLHELSYLSSDNLRIILRQARILINQANKYNNIESIKEICTEIDYIYNKYSFKNNSSKYHFNAFNKFLKKLK